MRRAVLPLLLVLAAGTAPAADLAGRLFRDRNGNGLPDPGEEGLAGQVEVFGSRDGGGQTDLTVATAADGSFAAGAPDLADGCFVVRVTPPPGFRLGQPRQDCPGSGLAWPAGTRRYSSPRWLIDALRANSALHIALGDSIAEPASGCVGLLPPFDDTDYVGWFGDRLACLAPGARTENHAIGGKLSKHLLAPGGTCGPPNLPRGGTRCDNVFDAAARNPDLVTISIGGNDFLDVEPTVQGEPFDPAEIDRAVRQAVETRRNVQEILSYLASELPAADVLLNTVYDNRSEDCAGTAYHNIWVPVWDQMLRDLVWGQGDRFHVAELHPEYAHQDLNGGNCCGERGRICDGDTIFGIDPPIHPDEAGARKHLERVWDAAGGVNLGPRDAIGATTNPDLLFPAEQRVAVRGPSRAEVRSGATANPADALARDDRGARVPSGDGEVVVSGFDVRPAGLVPTHVVVAVRYRTDAPAPAAAEVDGHWFEASLDGGFAAPAATVTGWNTVVPIVGAGADAPQPNALPDVPQWREVRALIRPNLRDDGRATGRYDWPVPGWSDLATLAVRLRGATRGAGPDARNIEWDAAWIEVYGHRISTAPVEVFRAASAVNLTDPANRIASGAAAPFADAPPAGSPWFYAVDDAAGFPGEIRLVRSPTGVEIHWP